MDLIEDIGPILGIVAFLGFAILALLIVLQAREVRRLREWAGRAPERALEADEADKAAAEAQGETGEEEELEEAPAGEGFRARVAAFFSARWAELDRRSPVDPRWFLAVLAAGLVAAGIVTSGFGLVGDDDAAPAGEQRGGGGGGGGGGNRPDRDEEPTVAVLNATQDEAAGIPATPGIADVVAAELVEPAGFRVEDRTNAPAGEPQSVIMFRPDAEETANELVDAVEEDLGAIEAIPITSEIQASAGGADLVLIVGQDDAGFGQAAAP
jgi:LytR cell envelope-related transcriptional attenuator